MSSLTAERDALVAAYAKGQIEVEFNGIRKRYDSEAGMRRRIKELDAMIRLETRSGRRLRVGLCTFRDR